MGYSYKSVFTNLDCKTAPSFARNPKIGVFDRVLARGREMGERGEEGVENPDFRISGEGINSKGLFCSLLLII